MILFQHAFHEECLHEVKRVKSECPLCRCSLTPLPMASLITSITHMSLHVTPHSNASNLRSAVIDAATRARNAVREAMERREQQMIFQRSLNGYGAAITA